MCALWLVNCTPIPVRFACLGELPAFCPNSFKLSQATTDLGREIQILPTLTLKNPLRSFSQVCNPPTSGDAHKYVYKTFY